MYTKVYYRWILDSKYEFYIDTGKRKNTSSDPPPLELSLMIAINIIGGGKVSNKKDRLKKRLMSPPKDFVIGTGETWCWLNDKEKRQYFELTEEELKSVLIKYGINLVWSWK